MMQIAVTLPSMLANLVGGRRTITVDGGDTVGDALAALTKLHPELAIHIFEHAASLRPHVSVFRNDGVVHDLGEPLMDGDAVTILQAVSGGSR
jgi:molybdopterin converting factor small subunit